MADDTGSVFLGVDIESQILPENSNNFFVQNVIDYDFNKGPFEIIISNPFYSTKGMREFTERCLRNLNSGGRLIYRIHNDVIKRNKISSLEDVPEFQGFDMKVIQGNGLILAIFDKK